MIPFLIKNKFIPRGKINLSGDKSIAHRALILSALSNNKTTINNFPIHDDSLATLNALKALGVKIQLKDNRLIVLGVGINGFKKSSKPIFVNNSGTTMRLLLGVLAGQDFKSKVIAAKYLSLRPMARVTIPLRLMGAKICARKKGKEEYAPIIIQGGSLRGITYQAVVASAQVKSAILLAGLFAQGATKIIEHLKTRDHTERMLKQFGASLKINKNKIILNPDKALVSPGLIYIPGDISSAAFFMVLAAIIPGAKIIINRVSLNPGRCGIINVLKKMKVNLKVGYLKNDKLDDSEPVGNIIVKSSKLKAVKISSSQIPSLVDELPIIMVAACFAQGSTVINGVGELRVKETDRINSMVRNLKLMGADIKVKPDKTGENIIIRGKDKLKGASLKSFGDHRTVMSMVVAAMAAQGESKIDDISCINKSFPNFLSTLHSLSK